MLTLIQIIKTSLIYFPFTLLLYPFSKLFKFLSYLMDMNLWILKNKNHVLIENIGGFFRNYDLRLKMFENISNYFSLDQKQIVYLEFGVASGGSFKWWLSNNQNQNSLFYGFDTFEGLPEDWGGFFKKGDMISSIPEINDPRAQFLKGLFQDTLPNFLNEHHTKIKEGSIRIIHCDADLYSATIFTLSQLFPFLKKGDIILFDEFNVPMHEFKAFKEFTENFYIKLRLIAQVNSFYQTVFIVE